MMAVHPVDILNKTELYTLNEGITWFVKYILTFKK